MNETVLDNRYAILKKIGTGGMSEVYCALDLTTNETVSIKMLKNELLSDEKAREMFRKEAEISIQLSHKNTVSAHELVEKPERMYIVLQYVEGTNLKDYIKINGALPEGEAVHILLQISRALRYAHNSGFIHKDVKPQNIILDKEGNAFLTDFGLAGDDEFHISETLVMGSVYYLSPEHAKGEAVSERSDIYSLGIVLYEMLTGKLPFTGKDTNDVIQKQLYADAIPPHEVNPNISIALSEIIMKAIAKDPEFRYVNFNNFIADVKRAEKYPDKSFVVMQAVPLAQKDVDVFRWRKLGVGIGVIVGIFALLLMISMVFRGRGTAIGTAMPNLRSMSMEEAKKTLDEMGVKYTIEYYDDEDGNNGTVSHQSPAAGSMIEQSDIVVLGIVLNSQNSELPDFSNMKREDALSYLDTLGISSRKIEYEESDLPYDHVTRQEPAAGSRLDRVNDITIYLSSRSESNQVPDVVGLSLEEARQRLQNSGYRLGIVIEEDGRNDTRVYTQLPGAGVRTMDVLTVDLTVGRDKSKSVAFTFHQDISVKQDNTTLKICYQDDDGTIYLIKEYRMMEKGIHRINDTFYAYTDQPKNVYIYYDNVRKNVFQNIEANR